MDEGFRGLPVFLANQFAGNAKNQLLLAIRRRKILSDQDIEQFIKAYHAYVDIQKERKPTCE